MLRKGPIVIDIVIVALFSFGGMKFHGVEGSVVEEFFRISLPFYIGVVTCGWGLGAYDSYERGADFARKSVGAMAVGLGASFFLRYCQRGESPTLQFLIPSLLFFFVFMIPLKLFCWKYLSSGEGLNRP